uniref:Uncharacterized protein n=1 Tax=Saimiri boliviensis boliviensis TaxID=39432 RepID=A0A2K6V5I6_SAIBB
MLFKSFKNTHHINLHLTVGEVAHCVLGLTQEQFLLDSLFDLFKIIIF